MERVDQLLAEANPHSQGKFSWDPVRMAELLALYPSLDPEDFVLHCLAAAVAGGATQFNLRKRGTSTVLSWNGLPLNPEDLDGLGPQGDTRQAALSLALNAAARLGRVQLSGAGGTLDIQPGRACRRLPDPCSENRLELVRSRWWYALAPTPSPALLRARAAYAPLQTNLALPLRLTHVPWAVRWGTLPRTPCDPHEWIELEGGSWGIGCAYPGQGRWTMVVEGLSYPIPDPWPQLDVVWWSSAFPLDLTRTQLVQGTQLQDWKNRLAQQLSPVAGPRHWKGVPLKVLIDHGGPEVWNAPWYQRTNGNIATLQELRQIYSHSGYLPIASLPGKYEAFLFPEGMPAELAEVFANWVLIHEQFPRLPQGEDYLVKIPLPNGRGEVGLRAKPSLEQREWSDKGWKRVARQPFGLDIHATDYQYSTALASIYACLQEREDHQSQAFLFHVLSLLNYLVTTRNITAASEVWTAKEFLLDHLGGVSVTELAERACVRMLNGQIGCLQDVMNSWWHYLDLNSDRGYACDLVTYWLIRGLSEIPANYELHSRKCHDILRPSAEPLLARMLADPDCAAYKALEALCAKPLLASAAKALSSAPEDTILRAARQEVGHESHTMTTIHILLALLRIDPAVREWLQGADVTRQSLLQVLPDWLETENLTDLDSMETAFEGSLRIEWYRLKVEALLRASRFEDALKLAQKSAWEFPNQWQSSRLVGLATGFRGDFPAAYGYLEDSLQRGAPGWLVQDYLWMAGILSGRSEMIQYIPLQAPESAQGKIIAASLQLNPATREQSCRDLLKTPNCPASVHEVLGNALADRGLQDEARKHWQLFLEARHDQLMEFDLPARQERIRAKLQAAGRPP